MDFVELMQCTLRGAEVTVGGRELLDVFERASARSHALLQEILLERKAVDRLSAENTKLRERISVLEVELVRARQ